MLGVSGSASIIHTNKHAGHLQYASSEPPTSSTKLHVEPAEQEPKQPEVHSSASEAAGPLRAVKLSLGAMPLQCLRRGQDLNGSACWSSFAFEHYLQIASTSELTCVSAADKRGSKKLQKQVSI